MEALRNSTGFFGPNLLADITLVVQILFFLVLCAGVVAQLQQKYKWHDWLQAPVVVLNILFILFVMFPTFGSVAGTLPDGISRTPTIIALIHGLLGTVAQLLAVYCLLAGFKILPRKIGVLRYWMWAAFSAWTATIIFGLGVYIVYYTPVLAAPVAPAGSEIITEHDADLEIEPPQEVLVEDQELVDEHAEEIVAPQPEVEPTQSPPTEEPVSEHNEEAAAPEPTATQVSEAAAPPDTTPVEETVDEQVADAAEAVEPEFVGETAVAQWQALQPASIGPSPRYQHAMQYNPATNQVFVFGGEDGSQMFNDVWALNMDTLTWRQLAANASPAPPARFSAVMTIDDAGENMYIATGHTQSGGNFGDIWRLNLATEIWEDLTSSAGPGPEARYGGPGGNLGGNMVLTHGFGSTRYDDTWQFNFNTGQWENITPAGAVPLRRCLFAAAPTETNLVIHGGCASGFGDCFLEDTWILDTQANAWREVFSDVKPAGRQYQSLVADAADSNRVVLFGGQDASRAVRNDVWSLDLTTGVWQPVDALDGATARYQHAAVWVPNLGMVVFGGRDDNGALDDLWLLGAQFRGETSPVAPAEQEPTATPEPPPEPTATPELVSEHDGG